MTCDLCYGPTKTSPCALCVEDREREEAAREARIEQTVAEYERELQERRAA